MNAIHRIDQTPKERLEYVASQSKPCPHEVAPQNYLTAIGLLLLVVSMVAVGIVAAMLGTDLLGEYARRIRELALP